MKSLTDKPVRYIINTHAHGDHTGGNQKFLPTTQITYTDEIALNLGGKEPSGSFLN